MAKKKFSAVGLVVFGLLFCGSAIVIIASSAVEAHQQAKTLALAIAEPAMVVKSDVTTKRKKKGTHYLPVVEFRYSYHGQEFTSQRVHVREMTWRNWSDAKAISDRHPVGRSTTAFVPPDAPERAFLERDIDFIPYLGMLFPLLHFSIGLTVLLLGLRPTEDRSNNVRRMGLVLLIDSFVIIGAFIHFIRSGGEFTLGPSIAAGITGGALLLGGWWWSHAYAKALAVTAPSHATTTT
jgi:hypothetical protein